MHVLLPGRRRLPDGGEQLDAAVYDLYAAPRRAWVRASFVASADGAAQLGATSGGLGSPTDQRVLATLRAQSDAVLVGAGTVRVEDYGPLRHSPVRTALRERHGFRAPARLAVVTRTVRFTGSERWLAQAPVPPLVITTSAGAREVPGAETVACGEESVDLVRALDLLAELGLTAILCEGGPTVFGSLAGSGRLDELCLTVAPRLAGPGATRIVEGASWPRAVEGSLTHLAEDDGFLFTRYRFTA